MRLREDVDPADLQEEWPERWTRWFHACGQRKCSFFEWAAREKLDAALGDQLRPLL